MLTRGSKVFLGLAIAAYLGGLAYGIVTNGLEHGGVVAVLTGDGAVDAVLGPLTFGYKGGVGDHVGYTLFMSAAVCSFGAAFAALAFRDGDPEALAELANADAVPPVSEPTDLSQWPIVTAFGAAVATLGLATSPLLFAIGCGVMAIAAIEWTIKDWSERATGDPEVNRIIRNRLMHPIEIPVAGFLAIAAVVYCVSRILLTSSKTGAVWVAIALTVVIFAVAVLIGTRPQLKRGAVVGAVLAGAVILLALGIFGAVRGEREMEHHGGDDHASAVVLDDYATTSGLGETDAS